MIVDARRSNSRFKCPPGVSLISAETLSRVEVELTEEEMSSRVRYEEAMDASKVHVGSADVKNCFHRMKILMWMPRCLALPAVPTKTMGMQHSFFEGRWLAPESPASPGWAVLPIGFSWNFYFAQVATAAKAAASRGVPASRGLGDLGSPW